MFYAVPGLEVDDDVLKYGFKFKINDTLKECLIFKKIDDNFAIEIGSGIKFFICNTENNSMLSFDSKSKELYDKLYEELKNNPLTINLLINCKKLTEEAKLDYIENIESVKKDLEKYLKKAKENYNKYEEIFMGKIYNLAKLDDTIFEYDRKYALKSDE